MATTQADIDTLEAACNSGLLTVTFDGPPRRSITYQSLDSMRRRLADMKLELMGSTRARFTYIATKTGF